MLDGDVSPDRASGFYWAGLQVVFGISSAARLVLCDHVSIESPTIFELLAFHLNL